MRVSPYVHQIYVVSLWYSRKETPTSAFVYTHTHTHISFLAGVRGKEMVCLGVFPVGLIYIYHILRMI